MHAPACSQTGCSVLAPAPQLFPCGAPAAATSPAGVYEQASPFFQLCPISFLQNLTCTTFGPDGNLYISNPSTHRILRFDGATGAFIDVFISNATSPLTDPRGMIFGANGTLYIAMLRMARFSATIPRPADISTRSHRRKPLCREGRSTSRLRKRIYRGRNGNTCLARRGQPPLA